MKPKKTPLAENITRRRKALSLTQPEFADLIGVHVNTIKDIERGISNGNPTTREAIATALKCEWWELERPTSESELIRPSEANPPDRSGLILAIQDDLKRLNMNQLEDLKDIIAHMLDPIDLEIDLSSKNAKSK